LLKLNLAKYVFDLAKYIFGLAKVLTNINPLNKSCVIFDYEAL